MTAITNNWFSAFTRPLWERHLLPLKTELHARGPMRYLELGVGDGQSMLWVLENLLTEPKDSAVGVDPYQPKRRHKREATEAARRAATENLRPYTRAERYNFAHERSFDFLTRIHAADEYERGGVPREFDLIYIDGDHAAVSCLEDAVLSWRLLRKGGVMVIDDLDRRWQHGKPHVREAVDAFERAYETRFRVLYREPRQVAFVKVK